MQPMSYRLRVNYSCLFIVVHLFTEPMHSAVPKVVYVGHGVYEARYTAHLPGTYALKARLDFARAVGTWNCAANATRYMVGVWAGAA